jgi:AcrR family transcriptional regulator
MEPAEPIRPARMIYRDAVSPTENTEPAARPARRRLAPDDRRQALINSALKLFNTHPYDEVSVDDIAAEAGMSRPLVYHYYGGKAGVFISALRQTGDDVVAAIAKAGMDNPDNWLAAGLGAFFDHIQANPIGLTALLQHGSLAGREDRQVLDEISDRVLRLILTALSRLARSWRPCCPNCCAPSSGPRPGTTPRPRPCYPACPGCAPPNREDDNKKNMHVLLTSGFRGR